MPQEAIIKELAGKVYEKDIEMKKMPVHPVVEKNFEVPVSNIVKISAAPVVVEVVEVQREIGREFPWKRSESVLSGDPNKDTMK